MPKGWEHRSEPHLHHPFKYATSSEKTESSTKTMKITNRTTGKIIRSSRVPVSLEKKPPPEEWEEEGA